MYKPVETFGFEGFFTFDRLSLEEASVHEKQVLPQGLEWGRKWEYRWFFTTITIPKCCEGKSVVFVCSSGKIFLREIGRQFKIYI